MALLKIMGSLNMHNMNTLRGTELRTRSPRIWNYADSDGETGTCGNFQLSHAIPLHIRMAQVITQQKLHDSCNVPSDRFNMQFPLRHGSLTCGHKPDGDSHNFIFFDVRPANQQPTINDVNLCRKNVGRPCFTETPVTRYQPFVSVHNVHFHSECCTNDKGSNQTYENNITHPLRIYGTLKFTHVIKYDRRTHSHTQT